MSEDNWFWLILTLICGVPVAAMSIAIAIVIVLGAL